MDTVRFGRLQPMDAWPPSRPRGSSLGERNPGGIDTPLALAIHPYSNSRADEIRTPPSSYFSSGSRAPRASTSHLISLRLSDELMRRLAEVGNDEGLAMSDTIRLVLEHGLGATRNP